MALEARVKVRLTDLSKPINVRVRTHMISPGQKSIELDLEGHYLYNFRLLCNPLLTEHGWNIAQNQITTASLVVGSQILASTDIDDMTPRGTVSAWYQTPLDFLDSPILVETLGKTKVRIDLTYIGIPMQSCYLQYDIGYHNNTMQNQVLTSGVTPVCYLVKTKYQNGYYFVGLTTLGGKLIN